MAGQVKLLAISAGPRKGGNSDSLLHYAMDSARESGAQTDHLYASRLKISPCVECNHCLEGGQCAINDDFQSVLARLLEADRIIFATPVFFMSVTAQAKMLIDRCQCLWARKYHLKHPPRDSSVERLALVIAVGGSRSRNMFDSIRWTLQTWLDTLDFKYAAGLFVNQTDAPGDIENCPEAIEQAHRIGRNLADAGFTAPSPATNIILP